MNESFERMCNTEDYEFEGYIEDPQSSWILGITILYDALESGVAKYENTITKE